MRLILQIFCLSHINKSIGTFYESEYFKQGEIAQWIRDGLLSRYGLFKRHSIGLTYMLEPREDQFDSMLAPVDGNLYQEVKKRMFTSPDAFTRLKNWKELYENK